MDGHHHATMDIRHVMSENEQGVFSSLLLPDDIYDGNGTYWADLPMAKRIKFVSSVDAAEVREETASLWAMFKKDPLSPVSWYMRNMVVPGAGLLLEGCVYQVACSRANMPLTLAMQLRAFLNW
jgi:hypothetical protein